MCFTKWPYLICCMCYIRWDFSSALAAVLLSLSEKPKRDFTRSDERHFNFLALCSVLSYLSLSLCFSLYPLNLTESLIILSVLCYLFPPWCSTSKTIWGQELPSVHLHLFVFTSFATKGLFWEWFVCHNYARKNSEYRQIDKLSKAIDSFQ